MKIDYISYSSVKSFLHGCQRLFWEKNINKMRIAYDTPYFAKGKAIHKCFEKFYCAKMEGGKFTREDFDAIFASYGVIDRKLVKESYGLFENFVLTRKYEDYEIIHPELAFDTYTDDGIRMKGFMDLVYRDGDDIYIVDYKSDIMERDYTIQQIVYSVAIRNLFKAKRYFFVLDFILSNTYKYEITDEIYDENLQIIKSVYNGMLGIEFEELEYRPGSHCASCPAEILKTCPYYKQATLLAKQEKNKIKKIDNKILEERKELNNMIKILTSRKDAIDNFIKENVKREDLINLRNNSIKFVPIKKNEYSFKEIYSKFGNKILEAAKINLSDLKGILSKEEFSSLEDIKQVKICGNKIIFDEGDF